MLVFGRSGCRHTIGVVLSPPEDSWRQVNVTFLQKKKLVVIELTNEINHWLTGRDERRPSFDFFFFKYREGRRGQREWWEFDRLRSEDENASLDVQSLEWVLVPGERSSRIATKIDVSVQASILTILGYTTEFTLHFLLNCFYFK